MTVLFVQSLMVVLVVASSLMVKASSSIAERVISLYNNHPDNTGRVGWTEGLCLVCQNFWQNEYCSTFVCIWQILSNSGLTRFKIFSRKLQINCVISFCFYLYLMFHACAVRFDITGNLKNFANFFGTKQALFSLQKFLVLGIVVLSFVFGNYYSIMNWKFVSQITDKLCN